MFRILELLTNCTQMIRSSTVNGLKENPSKWAFSLCTSLFLSCLSRLSRTEVLSVFSNTLSVLSGNVSFDPDIIFCHHWLCHYELHESCGFTNIFILFRLSRSQKTVLNQNIALFHKVYSTIIRKMVVSTLQNVISGMK